MPHPNKSQQKSIRLHECKVVSLPAYVRAWRALKALPADAVIKEGPGSWAPMQAGAALRQMRLGMHDRINRHDPAYGRGRKWDPKWQIEMRRAANDLNHPRLVIRWLPAELRERFAERLAA